MRPSLHLLAAAALMSVVLSAHGQSPAQVLDAQQLTEAGQIVIAGKPTPYKIRHLPVSSFPELPPNIAAMLNRRGCTIPQTYEAHGPENVIHASFEHARSSDWAALCSVKGTVSLLVFFGDGEGANAFSNTALTNPTILESVPETQRVQAHDASGVLGFDWGIDPATPRQIHDAQVGLNRPSALMDHDALADSVVDHRTIYHMYANRTWTVLEMQQ